MKYPITQAYIFNDVLITPQPDFFKMVFDRTLHFLENYAPSISIPVYEWKETIVNPDHGLYLKSAVLTSKTPGWYLKLECTEREPYYEPKHIFKHYLTVYNKQHPINIHIQYEEADEMEPVAWIDIELPEIMMEKFVELVFKHNAN